MKLDYENGDSLMDDDENINDALLQNALSQISDKDNHESKRYHKQNQQSNNSNPNLWHQRNDGPRRMLPKSITNKETGDFNKQQSNVRRFGNFRGKEEKTEMQL